MISSLEDFRLLLKKWRNESTQVAVMAVIRASDEVLSVLHVEGHMDKIDDSSFVVTDSDRDNIATVYFGNCTLMYHRAEDYFDPKQAKNYDDCILVSLDTNDAHANIVVLSAKTRKSNSAVSF